MSLKRLRWVVWIGTAMIALLLLFFWGYKGGQPTSTPEPKEPVSEKTSNPDWKVPTFRFTDQEGKPFGLGDLKGQVWVADMVLTECRDICPTLTANMAVLQKRLAQEKMEVQLVSFSVDPETDTPEVLKQYGEKFGADFSNWHFLTNGDFQKMKQFIESTFKVPVEHNHDPDATSPVMHSGRFFLVGASGRVVRTYDGVKPDYERIIQDIRTLQE